MCSILNVRIGIDKRTEDHENRNSDPIEKQSYQLLDEVLSTGIPIDINKGKKKLRIVLVEAIDIFDKLIPHPKAVIGDANDLVDISWENEVNLPFDTHINVWLYLKDQSKFFSPKVRHCSTKANYTFLQSSNLELQYLHEIGRDYDIRQKRTHLAQQIDLKLCEKRFAAIVSRSLSETWTRDPFDRLIVANAALHNDLLITKDANILNHYSLVLN